MSYQKIFSGFVFICSGVIFFCCSPKKNLSIELRFWVMGAEGEFVQQLMPRFEAEHSDLKVKIQMIPWTAAQEKLITAYASNNLPDLFQLGNTWIPQFAALQAIEDLNFWVRNSTSIRPDFYFRGIWNTNCIDSSLYGIPWYIDTRVLFYRRDVLARAGFPIPPRTWDELYEVSRRIKKNAGNTDKYAIYLPTNEWAPFVIFALQAGSHLLKNDDCFADFTSPEFKKAFSFLIRFHQEKLAPLGISQVTNVYQAFADEYFVMYISGPWNITEFKKYMKGNLADKWMTAPLPGLDQNTPGVSLAGGSSLVLNSKGKYKSAAWKLIEYLSRTETQVSFYHLVYDLPARREAWLDPSIKDDPYMRAFYEQFQHVVVTPKITEWEQIAFSKLQQYAELAARGAMPIDEALNSLNKDVDKILEKRRWLRGKIKRE